MRAWRKTPEYRLGIVSPLQKGHRPIGKGSSGHGTAIQGRDIVMTRIHTNTIEKAVDGVFFALEILHVHAIQEAQHACDVEFHIGLARPIDDEGNIQIGAIWGTAGIDKA